jgi:hypothetical protein
MFARFDSDTARSATVDGERLCPESQGECDDIWDVDLALFVIIGWLWIIGVHVGVLLALWHYSSRRR